MRDAAAANTLTIKGKKGEVVLTITDKTKLAEGKTLADVKVGDKLGAKSEPIKKEELCKEQDINLNLSPTLSPSPYPSRLFCVDIRSGRGN